MQSRQIIWLTMLLTTLCLAGCSESPELAASKKISKDLAQARDLMQERNLESYARAEKILQDALRTPDATDIAKQSAHELLATLLSEVNARQLTDTDFTKLQQNFAKADSDVHYSLSQLATKAAGFAYSAGLTISNDQTLQQYRQALAQKVPQAIIDKDNAVTVRVQCQQKLTETQQAVSATRMAAERLFIKAESLSGQERVSTIAQAAAGQLEADRLSIKAHSEQLVLQLAQEDELSRKAELANLQEVLQRVDKQITDHADSAVQTLRAVGVAKAGLQDSADKLLSRLEAFHELGTQMDAAYQLLIDRQGQAVTHYGQALTGAKAQSKRFRDFKARRPADAPPDELVNMMVPLDAEVALAVSVVQAEIFRASLRQNFVGMLERVSSRSAQIENTRKALTAVGVVMGSPQVDAAATAQSIQQARSAAVEDLSSAIKALRTTALPRQNQEASAEQIVEALERSTWNWQVFSMLGLAHQARAALYQQMGSEEQAQADSQAASVYLSKASQTRPSLAILAGSN